MESGLRGHSLTIATTLVQEYKGDLVTELQGHKIPVPESILSLSA